MKTLFSALMACFVLTGCAPQPGPVRIESFYGITPGDCVSADNQKNTTLPNGALDVNSGDAKFFAGVTLKSVALSQPSTVVNGRTIENANRDFPILEEMILSYTSKKGPTGTALAALKPSAVPQVLSFASNDVFFGGFQLMSNAAALAADSLTPSNDPEAYTDLTVNVEFTGKLSGSGGRIDTGTRPFTIRLTRRELTPGCTAQKAFGACNNPNQTYLNIAPVPVCCAPAAPGCPP
jgi:hypothetical protein